MSKILYLICGVPGSGKTTLADILCRAEIIPEYIEADQFFVNPRTGKYKFDSKKIVDAHDWCLSLVEQALQQNISIAVSNTFTKDIFLRQYYALAEQYGYQVIEIVMKSPFKCVHDVPDATVERMKQQLQARLSDNWVNAKYETIAD